ncbi:MAG: hypothetical protein EOP09_05535 [Proteobacteria bacterium]|nr:MAG: hypothetical protein EOP09_05535 [Pseudomonadota bacterium]
MIAKHAVKLVRMTRSHPRIKRGASVRAAIAIAELTIGFVKIKLPTKEAFLEAVLLALPTRIELDRATDSQQDSTSEMKSLIQSLIEAVENGSEILDEKKK